MFFDTHAHLNDERFDNIRESLILSLKENQIGAYCEIGFDVESSKKAVSLANKYDFVYSCAGIHPHDSEKITIDDLDEIKKLCADNKCVALGEIGLDYHYDNSPRDIQKKWFDAQLSLSEELNIPVCIHSREAFSDTYDILSSHKKAKGIIHCFSGKKENAKMYMDLGFYISFAGPVTYKNSVNLHESAKYVPLDKILIETDSPYLAPSLYRGKTNTPIYVKYVAQKLAELKEVSLNEIEENTFKNALKAYEIK